MGCGCDDEDDGVMSSRDIVLEGSCSPPAVQPQPPCQPVTTVVRRPCGHQHPVAGCCAVAQINPAVPFYLQTADCVEDHGSCMVGDEKIAIKIANSFNVPNCGQPAIISVPGVTQVMLGGYIWNPQYGYFRIMDFIESQAQITIQNDCLSGNAAPGTNVPVCTLFIVAPPPSSGSNPGQTGPYLAVDFLAPAVSTCINVGITTAQGLIVGRTISLNGGLYRIGAVINDSTMQICNDGGGITPNTPVIAKNAADQFQYPIIMIDDNPCTRETTATGVVMVCNAGVTYPLKGLVAGQVPVLGEDLVSAEYRSLGIPTTDCTSLTVPLIIDHTKPPGTSFLAIVGDTSEFSPTQTIQVGNDTFTVSTITDATHFNIVPAVIPGSDVVYNVGTTICSQSCCDRVTVLEDYVFENQRVGGHKWLQFQSDAIETTDSAATLTAGQTLNGTEATDTVINDTDLPMDVRVAVYPICEFTLNNTAAQYANLSLKTNLEFSGAIGAPEVTVKIKINTFAIPAGIGAANFEMDDVWEDVYTVPPNTTWYLKCQPVLIYNAGNANGVVVSHLYARAVISLASVL